MNPSEIEAIERGRRSRLIQSLVAFSLWQIPDILLRAIPDLPHAARTTLVLVSVLAGFVWIFCMWRMQRFMRITRRDPALPHVLNDERTMQMVSRALVAGFWMLLATAAVLVGWSTFLPLSGRVAGQIFILVGVCSAMIALLIYDRE